jgi:hypothetical protein
MVSHWLVSGNRPEWKMDGGFSIANQLPFNFHSRAVQLPFNSSLSLAIHMRISVDS